jgi:hypothetical protein
LLHTFKMLLMRECVSCAPVWVSVSKNIRSGAHQLLLILPRAEARGN